jgi:hypothetical protein
MLNLFIRSARLVAISNQGLPDHVLNNIARHNAGYVWMAVSLPTGYFALGDANLEQLRRNVGRACGNWCDIFVAGIDLVNMEANLHLSLNYRATFRTPRGWQMPPDLERELLQIISRALWRAEFAAGERRVHLRER